MTKDTRPSATDIVKRLNRLLPVSWDNELDGHGEPTHTNLTFGESKTQAMTLQPDDFMALNEIPALIAQLREEAERADGAKPV